MRLRRRAVDAVSIHCAMVFQLEGNACMLSASGGLVLSTLSARWDEIRGSVLTVAKPIRLRNLGLETSELAEHRMLRRVGVEMTRFIP